MRILNPLLGVKFYSSILLKNLRAGLGMFITASLLFSCNPLVKPPLFELKENTGVNFINRVEDNNQENCFQFRNFYNGGGVAIGDLNNDGLADIVFTSNQGENKIYLNKGNFTFEDISPKSGLLNHHRWSTGVSLVDIDHDGWLDIYICSSGHVGSQNRMNELYRNNHNGTFTECAARYGLNHSGYSTQAVFFDYDLDGDLDCLIIDNSPIPFGSLNYAGLRDSSQKLWNVPEIMKGGGNHLYRNDHGHYSEVTQSAGLHTSPISFGLGVTVSDINNDGYPDIYVGNDFLERDYLYINQKNGTFKDLLTDEIDHTSMSSMGTDIADMNNDGLPDIYCTDMFPENDYRLKTTGTFDNVDLYRSKLKAGFYHQYVRNCLQINSKEQHFKEVANYGGIAASDWSWGLVLFDADNDGFNDIYICNGINRDLSNLDFLDFFSNGTYQEMIQKANRDEATKNLIQKIPRTPLINKAYKNLGNLKFKDMSKDWGFTQTSFSNSVAYGDLNNDGALDLVVNNENGPAFIYQNHSREINQNNYIGIKLNSKGENTQAIGSKIKIYSGKQALFREIEPIRGFQSSVDLKQVIGLGGTKFIDSAIIIWPNGYQEKFLGLKVNKTYSFTQPPIKPELHFSSTNSISTITPLFQKQASYFDKHVENDYVDFYTEPNIPEMLSREGPKATVGDVNGDGLDDIFIGGALNQAGQLYLQNKEGMFKKSIQTAFGQFKGFEETACLFFDADGDGDLDLFVGSGGNTLGPNSRELQHRLYINDGKGNFKIDTQAFPNNEANTSVAVAFDFNGDGFLDLYVGSRNVPQEYGMDPQSHVYINDRKGHFRALENEKMGSLANIGMVTDARMVNLWGTEKKQLVVVGEWMSPHVFQYPSGHFDELKTNLNTLNGLWQMVLPFDFNGDGKMDLILGNIGENFYLHPDQDHPIKLWINDFNQNSHFDKILTYSVEERDLPMILKNDLETQIPFLKKRNLLHEDYARKSIQDLIPPELLKTALVKTFNYSPSVVAINQGNGQFKIEKLPMEAQLSSINVGISQDLNGDGLPDLVFGGNQFDFLPQFGRLDANQGLVYINKGKGKFHYMPNDYSELMERGEIRDLKSISVHGSQGLIWLPNDEYPALYLNRNKNLAFSKVPKIKSGPIAH